MRCYVSASNRNVFSLCLKIVSNMSVDVRGMMSWRVLADRRWRLSSFWKHIKYYNVCLAVLYYGLRMILYDASSSSSPLLPSRQYSTLSLSSSYVLLVCVGHLSPLASYKSPIHPVHSTLSGSTSKHLYQAAYSRVYHSRDYWRFI